MPASGYWTLRRAQEAVVSSYGYVANNRLIRANRPNTKVRYYRCSEPANTAVVGAS